MRVRVLFFGQLKDIAGVSQEDAELSEGARVEDLYDRYARRFPRLADFRASVAASVNQDTPNGAPHSQQVTRSPSSRPSAAASKPPSTATSSSWCANPSNRVKFCSTSK